MKKLVICNDNLPYGLPDYYYDEREPGEWYIEFKDEVFTLNSGEFAFVNENVITAPTDYYVDKEFMSKDEAEEWFYDVIDPYLPEEDGTYKLSGIFWIEFYTSYPQKWAKGLGPQYWNIKEYLDVDKVGVSKITITPAI